MNPEVVNESRTLPSPTGASSAPPAAAETPEEELSRLRRERAARELPDVAARTQRMIAKEKLVARFDGELGRRGSDYVLIDTGTLGDPLLIVKRAAAVQFEKWQQSKNTPTDRHDYISPCIMHCSESIETQTPAEAFAAYNVFRTKRVAIDVTVAASLADMNGILAEVEAGK